MRTSRAVWRGWRRTKLVNLAVRVGEQRGNGFGLSITRELAELYGGVELARSPMGGLSVALSLPKAT